MSGPMEGYGPNPERDHYRELWFVTREEAKNLREEVKSLRAYMPSYILADYDRTRKQSHPCPGCGGNTRCDGLCSQPQCRTCSCKDSACVSVGHGDGEQCPETSRNTPAGSRGATLDASSPSLRSGSEHDPQGSALAKRTEKTADRGTDLRKPVKRTVGSITIPELPWKRDA